MMDEIERNEEETPATEEGEELFEPQTKYERIMLAAAEAARLNEEMRRKGTKLDHKVTIEAVKRVDEGKVKAAFRRPGTILERPAPAPETPRTPLFSDAPAEAAVEGADGDQDQASSDEK